MAGYTGIGNVSPITASILAQPLQSVALKPGQIFQGIVQSLEPQTLLRFGNLVLPIERIEGIQPGQAVSAEVIDSGAGLQLRITPGTRSSTSMPHPEQLAQTLPDFIVDVLRTLGKLEIADRAVHLVPRQIAHNARAVRLALTLLLDDSTPGGAAQRLLQMIQQATDNGVVSSAEGQAAINALRILAGHEALMASVRQYGMAMTRTPIASRLAEALLHGDMKSLLDAMQDELVPLLERLRDNASLSSFFRKTGNYGEFSQAVDQVLERLIAAQLVNARSMDFPYLFFEVPMPPDSPIRRAQIHILGEGGGGARSFDAKSATIVFDISTETLGALWIAVGITQGSCSCWLRAQEMKTVELLDKHAARLVHQLSGAGYPNASIHTSLWDGDRVRELSTLMGRFDGIDVKA